MIRNLKALGLALAAVFALSAVAASSASAVVEDHFTVEGGGNTAAILTGTSEDNIFKITSPLTEFQCKTSKYVATVKNGDLEATVTPTYEGTPGKTDTGHCKASIGEKITVDMNSCDYDLTGKTDGQDKTETDAKVSITCKKTGDEIEITNPLCNIFIPAQTPTEGGVTYDGETEAGTGKKDVKVTITATGITWTAEDSFTCTLGGLKENNNADYTGTVTVTGYKDIESSPGVFTEGEKINIEVS